MGRLLKLAFNLLLRDWRSGELSLLSIALVVAVAGTSSISLFSDRLQRTMIIQAAEFLAADLVVTSHALMPESWFGEALQIGLQHARTAEFSSVLLDDETLLLTGVKAVSSAYPLRGYLKTSTQDVAEERVTRGIPKPGTAWVDKRVLSEFGHSLGDSIEVGEKRLRVTRLLTYEPDRRGTFSSLSPRVLINYKDLAATGIVQPGSHVHYYYLFAGGSEDSLAFKRWLTPQLVPGQRILDIHEDRPEIGTALSRAERYLGLASIIIVVIAGVAIAMATKRYSERHFDVTAILRCLGARQNEILKIYAYQLLILGVCASLIGLAVGWFAQEGIFYALKDLLPKNLVGPGLNAFGLGVFTGIIVLIGFSLPPILRLKYVSPMKVLRKDLEPLPVSAWLVYGMALSSVSVMLWWHTQDFKLTFYVIGIGMISLVVLSGLVFLLLTSSKNLQTFVSLPFRFGLQNLSRHAKYSVSQVLAFAITLLAMLVITLIRTDLVDAWQDRLPDDAPNYFALNIFPNEWQAFSDELKKNSIKTSEFFPIVRGRLIEVNGNDVRLIAGTESEVERIINRDFSMTAVEQAPPDNKILKGKWWSKGIQLQVSVEKSIAEKLKLRLQDILTFDVGGSRLSAPVTSIRAVNWDTMTPNFYMIFPAGVLDKYPSTYLGSFYLPQERKAVLNQVLKKFPTVTVLEVELLVKRFRTILAQVTTAVEYVLLFALLAGLTVLFASVLTSLDTRIYEGVMLRTLGANRRLLRISQVFEFVALGLLAGLLAAFSAQVLSWVLTTIIFDMDYAVRWQIWVVTPLIGAIVVGFSGYLSTRRVVNESPIRVLREL